MVITSISLRFFFNLLTHRTAGRREEAARADKQRAALLAEEQRATLMAEEQRAALMAKEQTAALMAEENQAVQEKLHRIGTCNSGAKWVKVDGGYKCKGGGHFVSDAELASA